MSAHDDPAYPVIVETRDGPEAYTGITKREVFAMAAMQGILAFQPTDMNYEQVAVWSVAYADALIGELAEPQS